MANFFERVRRNKVKYSKFDLSHIRLFNGGIGKLLPILCQEVVAGDTMQLNTELMIKFAPMVAPVLAQMNVYTHFFFVPNRLLWDDWEDFITGGESGTEDLVPPLLYFKDQNKNSPAFFFEQGSLADYLGLPSPSAHRQENARDRAVSSLPFRAYLQIYNDYYRDQNLTDPIDFPHDGGYCDLSSEQNIDKYIMYRDILNRCWKKDYFTSALPFAQRGTSVEVPISSKVSFIPSSGFGTSVKTSGSTSGPSFPVNSTPSLQVVNNNSYPSPNNHLTITRDDGTVVPVDIDNSHNLKVDSVGLTVRTLRRLFAVQRFEENNAVGGSRYQEQLLLRFGVRSLDSRLQRAEYLGGGKQPVVISETLQTSQTTDSSVLGTPGGQASSVGRTHQFKRRFHEHGWLIGIMSIIPRASYGEGIPRQFSRLTRYDYLTPEFANIGEQEVLNKEIYMNSSNPNGTFGYQSRYSEYKYIPDSYHGKFKTNLNFWHMGRMFDKQPNLNKDFMEISPTAFERIFAVSRNRDEQFYCQLAHHLYAKRALPKYPTT